MNAAIEWLEQGFAETQDFYSNPGKEATEISVAYCKRFTQVIVTLSSGLYSLKRDHELADNHGWCGLCVESDNLIVVG